MKNRQRNNNTSLSVYHVTQLLSVRFTLLRLYQESSEEFVR